MLCGFAINQKISDRRERQITNIYLLDLQSICCGGNFCNRLLQYDPNNPDVHIALCRWAIICVHLVAFRLKLNISQMSGYCPQVLISWSSFSAVCLDALCYTSYLGHSDAKQYFREKLRIFEGRLRKRGPSRTLNWSLKLPIPRALAKVISPMI